jgi:hypothetical protein
MVFGDVLHLLVKSPCESMIDAYSSVFIGMDIGTHAISCCKSATGRLRVPQIREAIGAAHRRSLMSALRGSPAAATIRAADPAKAIRHSTKPYQSIIDKRRCG